jgi:hypothetical protein
VSEPPADILRRLRPIPTYVDQPTTVPHDVVGVGTDGLARRVDVVDAATPVLLLFLSADCLGCRDLWDGLAELSTALGGAARLAVVTRDPAEEDPGVIETLAGPAAVRAGVGVVMSTAAFAAYRVGGPPFLVLVDAEAVRTESVAWGLDQTLRIARAALPSP